MNNFVLYLLQKLNAEDIRSTGEGYECCCPFHKGKARNFRVKQNGLFFCHNVDCAMRGNLIHLCKLALGVNFKKVLEILDNEGLPITKKTVAEYKKPSVSDIIPYRSYTVDYLLDRGYREEDIRFYDIVYNPTKNLILFPVYSTNGDLISVVSRKPGNGNPYIQLTGVEKSKQVFGLYQAVKQEKSGILITEGHADPLGAIQLNTGYFPVAIGGCVLSESQAKQIVQFSKYQAIGLDNEKEGIIGTYYAIQRLRKSGSTNLRIFVYTAGDPGEIPRTSKLTWEMVLPKDWLHFHRTTIQEHLRKKRERA